LGKEEIRSPPQCRVTVEKVIAIAKHQPLSITKQPRKQRGKKQH